jgi:hypothetical protein
MDTILAIFMPFIVIIGGLTAGFAPIFIGAVVHQYTEKMFPKGCWILTAAAFFLSVHFISRLLLH